MPLHGAVYCGILNWFLLFVTTETQLSDDSTQDLTIVTAEVSPGAETCTFRSQFIVQMYALQIRISSLAVQTK